MIFSAPDSYFEHDKHDIFMMFEGGDGQSLSYKVKYDLLVQGRMAKQLIISIINQDSNFSQLCRSQRLEI